MDHAQSWRLKFAVDALAVQHHDPLSEHDVYKLRRHVFDNETFTQVQDSLKLDVLRLCSSLLCVIMLLFRNRMPAQSMTHVVLRFSNLILASWFAIDVSWFATMIIQHMSYIRTRREFHEKWVVGTRLSESQIQGCQASAMTELKIMVLYDECTKALSSWDLMTPDAAWVQATHNQVLAHIRSKFIDVVGVSMLSIIVSVWISDKFVDKVVKPQRLSHTSGAMVGGGSPALERGGVDKVDPVVIPPIRPKSYTTKPLLVKPQKTPSASFELF